MMKRAIVGPTGKEVKPYEAYTVGRVRRNLGVYQPAIRSRGFDFEDDEPACLAITGTVTLMQCRVGDFRRVVDVALGDLIIKKDKHEESDD